ncbi:hypothetical protein KC336_g53 [Hortaea werneckii]|nr:hypothetical protein KC336_g53 [Hortaea werneckii]
MNGRWMGRRDRGRGLVSIPLGGADLVRDSGSSSSSCGSGSSASPLLTVSLSREVVVQFSYCSSRGAADERGRMSLVIRRRCSPSYTRINLGNAHSGDTNWASKTSGDEFIAQERKWGHICALVVEARRSGKARLEMAVVESRIELSDWLGSWNMRLT